MISKRAALLTILFLLVAVTFVQAQATRPAKIELPEEMNTEERVRAFIQVILNDDTKRPDPFLPGGADSIIATPGSVNKEKPRPESGFGRYDVETLTLMAIFEKGGQAVAMVRAPDGLTFIIRKGDEAYDGNVVEVNLARKQVVFEELIQLEPNPLFPDQPREKLINKYVEFRN